MVNAAAITLALGAGLITFLSPCGVAMLPAYMSYTFTKQTNDKSKRLNLIDGLKHGIIVSLGLIITFMLTGLLIIYFGNFIKIWVPWITLMIAMFLIILGVIMLLKKDFTLKLPFIINIPHKHRSIAQFFTFGIAYGFAVMSCTLPVFLAIIFSAISLGNTLDGIIILLAYALAASATIIAITVITALSKVTIMKKIAKVMPYLRTISAAIIIAAGIYIAYYQIYFNQIILMVY